MEARDCYTIAYEIESKDPKRALLYYLLSYRRREKYDNIDYRIAISYYKINNYQRSVKWIRKSITARPHGVSYIFLSKSLIQMCDWQSAIEALNEAKLFGTNIDQINALKALCYLCLEDWETLNLTLADISDETALMRTIYAIHDLKNNFARQIESISNLNRDSLNIVRLYSKNRQEAIRRIISKHVK